MKDEGLREVNRHAMRRIEGDMNRMLSSFEFVGPVRDGANWTEFFDSGCGGWFEYPEGSEIRRDVEWIHSCIRAANTLSQPR